MKKLTIGILISIFLTSNALAITIIPNIPDYRAPQNIELPSKTFSGYGKNIKHDQAPDFLSEDYYEIKFDTPITCADCAQP